MKAMVSILCITYNQEKYIGQAIESFLMQETNFPFEIIIHDDASTDGTANIIRSYENIYPSMIKGIYQVENQHSKRKKIFADIISPKASGKYFAICEGDDFWTDKSKLQKQFDFMEEHPNTFLCAHDHTVIDAITEKNISNSSFSKEISFYQMETAIKGFGREVATNSMFLKREVLENFPDFARKAPCGDYVWPILAAYYGNIGYLPYNMCAHRVNAQNSFSLSCKNSLEKRINYNKRYELMLDKLDDFTEHKYSDIINYERIGLWFRTYYIAGDYCSLKEKKFKIYIKNLPTKQRLLAMLQIYFPNLTNKVKRIFKKHE